jgi:hypothetical protein
MPRYTEDEAREAVAASKSYSEALRRLRMRPAGGNHKLFKRYVDEVWQIPTAHFDAGAAARRVPLRASMPMSEVLVEHSSYTRARLKQRLYEEGLKQRRCELCGQGEEWRGRVMSLILDHVNGVPDDNRLENLRIVCPNCAATLDTHCGRKNRQQPLQRKCRRCGREFLAKYPQHRYCSHACGCRWDRAKLRGVPKPEYHKVERPPYEKLMAEIEATSYCAVGRKYGVSDNAVRKWVRFYERQRARGEHPPDGDAGRDSVRSRT